MKKTLQQFIDEGYKVEKITLTLLYKEGDLIPEGFQLVGGKLYREIEEDFSATKLKELKKRI